jgi:integrase/recombinase XerD
MNTYFLGKAHNKYIINYFEYYKQINPNIMASSLETIRSDIRAFFVWMKDENIITENPMLKIKPFKTDKVLRKPLSIRELEILRYNCDDLRLRAMMETFYASGCRLSELSQINKDDIDWQNERLIIRGKGNKDRYIFLTSRAVIHLQKYIESRHDSCEALFVTIKKPYRRLGKRAIEKEIHKLGIEAGFNDSVFCHRFRHTTASLLVSNGAPLPVVQEIMGHSTISTTMEYTHITPEFKQQNYKRYMNQ